MTDSTTPLPRNLLDAAEREGRTAWLGVLPATVARLAREWSLTVEAPFQPGRPASPDRLTVGYADHAVVSAHRNA